MHLSTDGIKFDTLNKLCKALNCSVGDSIEYVNEEDKLRSCVLCLFEFF
ncbi:helix-turn-helix domain-containing protein [Cytobacillus citreus]|nr:helix-turn-helix domain-containing protein [Cytobacillus citreus]